MYLVSVIFSVFILISVILSTSFSPVRGDGLFQEQLSASLGDRKADLLIKMNPPVVTTETLKSQSQKPVIEFRMFDSATNKSISHVTYFITIEKGGKTLLTNWFHDHNGDLRIEMKPRNSSQITVYGEQDPILNAFTGTTRSPVLASGPIFEEGGLYHFKVRIATVDYDRTLIPDNNQPVYDGYLSVGNTENYNARTMNGTHIPIKIISYYDKLKNIDFEPDKSQLNFSMPFNWNLSRIKDVKIFVHEEISIPKPSQFSSKAGYSGKINGIELTAKQLMIDPSNATKDVVHFMLSKDSLIDLAKQVNSNSNHSRTSPINMQFLLKPVSGAAASNSNQSIMGSSMKMSG